MKKQNVIDLVVFAFIFLFLLSYFEPQYLFSLTTTSGGDTGSHYPTAIHLKEVLMPAGKIMGWDMGNYAGFPIFYHYFPLTFLITVLFSYLIPMQIAFKLVTVLGTFLLPVFVYLSFRLLKYKFPIPIMAGVFSLAFLFLEANSMWGGNIPSTLAGEYSYSLGLALVVLFFGTLYHGIKAKDKIILNSFLVVLMGLSHGYTLIFSGVIGAFFLLNRESFFDNLKYLFKVFGLAFLLLSFWLIPFIGNLPFVTTYVAKWHIGSIFEVAPLILIPFFVLAVFSFFINLFDKRTLYFAYTIIACGILYFLSPQIGMLDIRWIPFIQLFLVIFGATFLLVFLKDIKFPQFLPFITVLIVVLWVLPNVTFIKGWIKWNYDGFEKKSSWPLFRDINDYLSKGGKGRVVYEHSPSHNTFGTERAFENLPHFAKRNTLEGLYMQSSISSPFIFYIQSEVSKVCSGPFPQYKYTSLNLPAAIPHLKMFNVTHYIARSPQAKDQAKTVPELKLEKQFGEYEIYGLTSNDGSYVVPVNSHPIVVNKDNWKQEAYDWFRSGEQLEYPIVGGKIEEKIGDEEISFKTNLIGKPHLIKVSYHPNWKIVGADKIYLAYPSFMLVYPNQERVRLYFGKTIYNYVGEALSLIGLSIVLISGIISLKHARKT